MMKSLFNKVRAEGLQLYQKETPTQAFSCVYSRSPTAIEQHVFFLLYGAFCIDIFSKNDYKRKNITPIKRTRASSQIKWRVSENFDGELEAK